MEIKCQMDEHGPCSCEGVAEANRLLAARGIELDEERAQKLMKCLAGLTQLGTLYVPKGDRIAPVDTSALRTWLIWLEGEVVAAKARPVAETAKDLAEEPGSYHPTLLLGQLIDALKRCDPDDEVRYDFGYLVPDSLDSYRGDYAHLALGYGDGSETVKGLLRKLTRAAEGQTFHGWKGGEYVMDMETPVWVANSGEAPGTTIERVASFGSQVFLVTGNEDVPAVTQ